MYVVDTCVFNWLLDGRIAVSDLPQGGDYISTHVQADELGRTPCEARRLELQAVFRTVVNRDVATESVVLGVSRAGRCKLSDGELYESLRAALNLRNNSKQNNSEDALIAEVAIVNGWTLLTADRDLAGVVEEHSGRAVLFGA